MSDVKVTIVEEPIAVTVAAEQIAVTVADTVVAVTPVATAVTAVTVTEAAVAVTVSTGGSSGSTHDAVTLDANANTIHSLSTQELGLDVQGANKFFGGPVTGVDAIPTVRLLVDTDIPAIIARDAEVTAEIATHAAIAAAHHACYTDAEAVAAILADNSLLRRDGTLALTAPWNAGNYQIAASQFESTTVTGTAPLVIASATMVTNLNADLLDGQHGAYYAPASAITGTVGRVAQFVTASTIGDANLVGPTANLLTFAATVPATLTVPETGTAGLLGRAQTWTAVNSISEIRAADVNGLKLYDDGGNGIFVKDGGQVGIGTDSPDFDLDVDNGTIRALRYRIGGTGSSDGRAYAYWNTASVNLPSGMSGACELGFAGSYSDSRFPARLNAKNDAYLEAYWDGTSSRFSFVNGYVGINETTLLAQLHIQTSGAAVIGQIIQLSAMPSEAALEVRDSGGTILASITQTGGARYKDAQIGDGTNYLSVSATGAVTLAGTARKDRTVTINFDHTRIIGQGKPTQVFRGIHTGFSLPVFASNDEELYSCKSAALEWDDTATMAVHVGLYLDTANTSKKFKLQMSWDSVDLATNEVVGSGSTDVEVETTTGTDAQYTGYKIAFPMDTVTAGCSNGNKLGFRLRRIAASADEIAGEVVVCGMALKYTVNKMGG